MCVPVDSELPDLGLTWPLPSGAPVALTTTDGIPFRSFVAQAVEPSGTGFVVLPDIRGLFSFYERLTEALAFVGFDAVAIDYFGRTSGIEPRDPEDDPWPALDVYTAEQASADVGVAITQVRESLGVGKVVVLGFCFGGLISIREGYADHAVDGVVAAYGGPAEWGNFPSAFERIEDFRVPVLGLFAEADHANPVEGIRDFDAAMNEAGKPHDITIYAGAPHSFFDRHHAEWADASRDAWDRIVAFGHAC